MTVEDDDFLYGEERDLVMGIPSGKPKITDEDTVLFCRSGRCTAYRHCGAGRLPCSCPIVSFKHYMNNKYDIER